MTTATAPQAPSPATSRGGPDARAPEEIAVGAAVVLGVVLGVFGSVGLFLDPSCGSISPATPSSPPRSSRGRSPGRRRRCSR